MKKKARTASTIRIGTQTRPQFWIQTCPPPNSGGRVWLPPPRAPNRPKVMTKGSSTCITLTPTLPRPALSPSDVPCTLLGKKKLMFDIEEAKAPPPTPDRAASMAKVIQVVSAFCSAMPTPSDGAISSSDVTKITLRPPEIAIMNELGMRSVAPASPAIAGSV